LLRKDLENMQRAAGTTPAFSNLFKVLDSIHNVPPGILFGHVQEVDDAGRVRDINRYVTYLTQPIRALVLPQ
jgi:hypothetical protein